LGSKFFFKDLGSKTGSFKKIDKVVLEKDMEIMLGNSARINISFIIFKVKSLKLMNLQRKILPNLKSKLQKGDIKIKILV